MVDAGQSHQSRRRGGAHRRDHGAGVRGGARFARRDQRGLRRGPRLGFNIAAKLACDTRFMRGFLDRLAASGQAQRFMLEITEEAFLPSGRFQTRVLPMIREIGAHISIDDFGAGYSSLATLADITADEVKVDRSLIVDIDKRPRSQSLLASHRIDRRGAGDGGDRRGRRDGGGVRLSARPHAHSGGAGVLFRQADHADGGRGRGGVAGSAGEERASRTIAGARGAILGLSRRCAAPRERSAARAASPRRPRAKPPRAPPVPRRSPRPS